MMADKISVIVPVYNVEKYLPACIESIISQTHQNLEIILVNDGSTDRCPAICDAYAVKDFRIKVIHKDNGGLSDARNAGLKVATGDFIAFVDSDDLLSLQFCQKLIQSLLENNADIVECGFLKFKSAEELREASSSANVPSEVFDPARALELLMQEDFKQVVWNKLYRRDIAQKLEFPVGKLNEDEFWTYRIFGSAKRIARITDLLYFYRQQDGSIMGSAYNLRRLDGLEALEQRIQYMKENFPELENIAVKIYCMGSIWHYQKLTKHSETDPGGVYRNKIIQSLKGYNKTGILKKWKIKEVFWFKFFNALPQGYAKFRNFINIGI